MMPVRKKIVATLPTLGREERALLMRLLIGQTKLRRFPSLQWSVSGKNFIRSSMPERLERLGLIEQRDVSNKGVRIYVPTERARALIAVTEKAHAVLLAAPVPDKKYLEVAGALADARRLPLSFTGASVIDGEG